MMPPLAIMYVYGMMVGVYAVFGVIKGFPFIPYMVSMLFLGLIGSVIAIYLEKK
jgi:hypothetical protein